MHQVQLILCSTLCVPFMLCYIELSHHKAEQHEGQSGACQHEQSLYSSMSALLELVSAHRALAVSLYMYIQVY